MKRVRSIRPPRKRQKSADDSEIGYCKPPKHTQFKKGQSGNPKGRPKTHRNFKTIVADILYEPVQIRQGERTRFVPFAEAWARKLASNALHGDSKAHATVLTLVKLYEGLLEESSGGEPQEILEDGERILADFFARNGEELTKKFGESVGTKKKRSSS